MLDVVESRFNAIGLKPDLNDLKVVRSGNTPDIARVADGELILADKTFPKEEMLVHITRAIGFAQAERFTEETTNRWCLALVPASLTRIKAVQQSLSSSSSFTDALDKMDMPVTRLIAVHLFNALISGGMSFANAKTVDFEKWGSTSDLVFGKKMFSLLPLLGAYAPQLIATSFPLALTDLVCNNLACVTHSDVRAEFSNLIVEIFNSDLAVDGSA
jgi:hypothetical protein